MQETALFSTCGPPSPIGIEYQPVIINRDFNNEIWKIVRELRRVPNETVRKIGGKLETLLKKHDIFDLNTVPSRGLVGAILASTNFPWDDVVPTASKSKRSKKDQQLLQRVQFWIQLARDIKYNRKSENTLAQSIGLSPDEFAHLKTELRNKGWLD